MSVFLPVIEYEKIDEGWQVIIHLSKDNQIKGDIIDELPAKIKDKLDYSCG